MYVTLFDFHINRCMVLPIYSTLLRSIIYFSSNEFFLKEPQYADELSTHLVLKFWSVNLSCCDGFWWCDQHTRLVRYP